MKYTCVSEIPEFYGRTFPGKDSFKFFAIMGYDSKCYEFYNKDFKTHESKELSDALGISIPTKIQSKSCSSQWEIRGFHPDFDFSIRLDTFYVNFVHLGKDISETREIFYKALFNAPYEMVVHKKREIPENYLEASISMAIKLLLSKGIT